MQKEPGTPEAVGKKHAAWWFGTYFFIPVSWSFHFIPTEHLDDFSRNSWEFHFIPSHYITLLFFRGVYYQAALGCVETCATDDVFHQKTFASSLGFC